MNNMKIQFTPTAMFVDGEFVKGYSKSYHITLLLIMSGLKFTTISKKVKGCLKSGNHPNDAAERVGGGIAGRGFDLIIIDDSVNME